jgi:hypothetical protein
MFHSAEAGVQSQRTDYTKASLNAMPVSVLLETPADVAKASPKGLALFLAMASVDAIKGLMDGICKATLVGDNSVNPDEFDGVLTVLNNLEDVRVVNGGATGAGKTTRIAVIGFASNADVEQRAEGVTGVALGFGGNGSVGMNDDGWVLQQETVFNVAGAATNARIMKYINAVNAHVGLHIGAPTAISALVNIDAAHPPTADLLDEAISKIRALGVEPAIIMSRAAATWFKKWRRTLGGYIDGVGPNQPLNHEGYPIYTSDYITDDYDVIEAAVGL